MVVYSDLLLITGIVKRILPEEVTKCGCCKSKFSTAGTFHGNFRTEVKVKSWEENNIKVHTSKINYQRTDDVSAAGDEMISPATGRL